jgi:2-amino-4-hydroxy-6-hydroxymethyldihydropteridine diphosphokinase
MARAYLGLGSNLGDKPAMLREALRRLDEAAGVKVVACSGFYRTPPWGKTDQDWFLNTAAAVETDLSPHDLLGVCLSVERSLGRVRDEKWGPRLIDIDVLIYDGRHVADETLTLPHPHLAQRAFVLVPLAEIAPDLRIGESSVAEALARVDRGGIERMDDL